MVNPTTGKSSKLEKGNSIHHNNLKINWTQEVTIGIKTFIRPKCLKNCINSIRNFYPTIPIIVADDSTKKIKKINSKFLKTIPYATHLELPFDVGLSTGRNRIVKNTKTKYMVIVDDDTIFTVDTQIQKMYRFLEETGYDLIGGTAPNSKYLASFLYTEGNYLYYRKRGYGDVTNSVCQATKTDRTLNYFMAKTSQLRANPWIDKLKLCEHTAFFVQAWEKGWKMAFTPDVVFRQKKYNTEEYRSFRYKRIEKYCARADKITYTLVPLTLKKEKSYRTKNKSLTADLQIKLLISRKPAHQPETMSRVKELKKLQKQLQQEKIKHEKLEKERLKKIQEEKNKDKDKNKDKNNKDKNKDKNNKDKNKDKNNKDKNKGNIRAKKIDKLKKPKPIIVRSDKPKIIKPKIVKSDKPTLEKIKKAEKPKPENQKLEKPKVVEPVKPIKTRRHKSKKKIDRVTLHRRLKSSGVYKRSLKYNH